jgi:hypothetical protein
MICALPKMTKNNERVSIYRLIDLDSDKFDIIEYFRTAFMLIDAASTRVIENKLNDAEVSMLDLRGFSSKHVFKAVTNFSAVKTYLKYVQEAIPIKISANHLVNCSPFFMKLLSMSRPFLKKEVKDSLHFHSMYDSLHEFIPREILPFEYGGEAGKIDDIFRENMKVVESRKEYLSDDSNWKLL